jgi:CubicO group peptidase (beta-lactamase class C family)
MRRTFLLIAIGLSLFNLTFGQSAQYKQLDSLVNSLFKQKMFNGNVLIADKGKIIFEKSYGLANEKTEQKINNHTIFELASVSKQFTAMGIVLLEKQGKLNYDDKISKYIPELAFYGNISIRNLLNHTGGLPDYIEFFEQKWDKTKIATNQDIVNVFAKYRPKVIFQPGEKYEYSDTGYTLLALIIEKVSGRTFGQFLSKNIFQPLKMKNTFIYRSRFEPKKIDNYALGYVTDSSGHKVLPNSFGKEFYTYYLDAIVGDGTVNSTTEDLLIWDRALYTNKLVDSKDKELIFNSVKTKDGKETNYGFGWFIGDSKKYGKIVYHSGGWPGYSNYIERHLDNDKTIIILQNHSNAKINSFLQKARTILYN